MYYKDFDCMLFSTNIIQKAFNILKIFTLFSFYVLLFLVILHNHSMSYEVPYYSNQNNNVNNILSTEEKTNFFEYHLDNFIFSSELCENNLSKKYIKIYWSLYPIKNIISNRAVFRGKKIYSINNQFFNISSSFGYFLTNQINYDLSFSLSINPQKKFLDKPATLFEIDIISSGYYNINQHSGIFEFIENNFDSVFLEKLTFNILNKFQPFISLGAGFDIIFIQPKPDMKAHFHIAKFIDLVTNPTIGIKYKTKKQIYITSAFSYTYGIPLYSYLSITKNSSFSYKSFANKNYGYGFSIGIEKHF